MGKMPYKGLQRFSAKLMAFPTPLAQISMFLMNNGGKIVQEMDYGDIPPSGNGAYLTWVSSTLNSTPSCKTYCTVKRA
ncbi:hypothetical protein MC885_019699, partial [Smutsia gigantea]